MTRRPDGAGRHGFEIGVHFKDRSFSQLPFDLSNFNQIQDKGFKDRGEVKTARSITYLEARKTLPLPYVGHADKRPQPLHNPSRTTQLEIGRLCPILQALRPIISPRSPK